jgi:hypothetical protein
MKTRFLAAALAALALPAAAHAQVAPPSNLPALDRVTALAPPSNLPAAPVSPDALPVPDRMPAARCGCTPGACPTPGFCGGAGCQCGTARAGSTPAGLPAAAPACRTFTDPWTGRTYQICPTAR